MSEHESTHKGTPHIVPVGVYIAVFASLLALTGLTYLIYWFNVDLGPLNLAAAISIEC